MTVVKEEPVHYFTPNKKPFKCPTCGACFSTAATLRRHELEKHMKGIEPIFLVDEERGIFATSQDKSGPRTIVHVRKSFNQQVLDCEVESCREFMAMANGKECMHLERVRHLQHQELPALLQSTSIEDMFQKGMISCSTKQDCIKLNQQAIKDRTACVYPVFFNEHGFSGRKVNFSVFTSTLDSWAVFGRTRVTLDTDSGKWTCRCKSTKKHKCVHIYVSICWTYQERRHLLRDTELDFSSDTDDDLDNEDMEPGHFREETNISSVQIKKKWWNIC